MSQRSGSRFSPHWQARVAASFAAHRLGTQTEFLPENYPGAGRLEQDWMEQGQLEHGHLAAGRFFDKRYWRTQLWWALGVSLFTVCYLFTPAIALHTSNAPTTGNVTSSASTPMAGARLSGSPAQVAVRPAANLGSQNIAELSFAGIHTGALAKGPLPGAPNPNPNPRPAPNPNPNPDPGNNPPGPQPVPGETNRNQRLGPNQPGAPQNPEDLGKVLGVFGFDNTPSTVVTVFLAITLLSVAPSLLLMMTSFTKIFITLAMSRNAIGLQQVPPNQVIAGLALFLTIFVMSPVITEVNSAAIQPYLHGDVTLARALELGAPPLRDFMSARTREEDIALITRAAGRPNPETIADVPFTTLVPSFMISEVRSAFIIGFVVFIPFLVIDLVVGASLMSMGMMMLPPVMVSLPFKILLFVMVDGWGLLTQTLIGTYR